MFCAETYDILSAILKSRKLYYLIFWVERKLGNAVAGWITIRLQRPRKDYGVFCGQTGFLLRSIQPQLLQDFLAVNRNSYTSSSTWVLRISSCRSVLKRSATVKSQLSPKRLKTIKWPTFSWNKPQFIQAFLAVESKRLESSLTEYREGVQTYGCYFCQNSQTTIYNRLCYVPCLYFPEN